jgi:hypothetical protein
MILLYSFAPNCRCGVDETTKTTIRHDIDKFNTKMAELGTTEEE